MKALVLIDIPDRKNIKNILDPFTVNVSLDYGNEMIYLTGEIKKECDISETKNVVMDTYNNLMICPHCGEILGTTSDWTPNYCYECGNPLSGGNGKCP